MIARTIVTRFLRRIEGGSLTVVEPGRTHTFGDRDEALRVTVTLRDARVWRALLRGSTGLGESYMDGRWDADDLTALVRLAARNALKLDRLRSRFAFLVRPVQFLRGGRANTRAPQPPPDRRATTTSATTCSPRCSTTGCSIRRACSRRRRRSLEEAQVAKLDAICAKLELRPDDHLLEIGTGWGGLAIHAASRYGCRVTTTTISREQHAEATRRVRAAGLDDRVTVLLRDYRELTDTYDKLVAIEMIEAVGWRNFDRFFSRVQRAAAARRAGAAAGDPDRRPRVRRGEGGRSFITTFIFPGGALPSMEVMARCVRRHTNLQWLDVQDLTADYVLTLRHWRERFLAARARPRGRRL